MNEKRAKKEIRWRMRRDCARIMAGAAVAGFWECLLSIVAPTVISLLLGDMANELLYLDGVAIRQSMPAFVMAILIEVLLVPSITLGKNLLLTKQGTAYDVFLMNNTLHMPQKELHAVHEGDYIRRFERDRTLYYTSIVRLLSYPAAVVLYLAILAYLLYRGYYNFLYCLCILVITAASVIYDTAVAKQQAELRKQTTEYEGMRTQQELEIFSLRDFGIGFGLKPLLLNRLRKEFECFWSMTGRKQSTRASGSDIMQIFCEYGAQVTILLVGAILMASGKLTLGALFSGYLLIPTIKKGWEYGKQIYADVKNESSYGDRMMYFYQDTEPEENCHGAKEITTFKLNHISFSYQASEHPVLSDFSLILNDRENFRIMGENGCGKSTLLSIIGGINSPDSGKVIDMEGNEISPGVLRRMVSIQEQSDVVFSGTVWENLFLPEKRKVDAVELLADLGFLKELDYRIENDGKNLSPGERKKILLTRALLKEAPFLALDEPMNHLDIQGQKTLIRRLKMRHGGIILVSHDRFPEEEICFKEILM